MAISSPRRAKSALRIEGAIRTVIIVSAGIGNGRNGERAHGRKSRYDHVDAPARRYRLTRWGRLREDGVLRLERAGIPPHAADAQPDLLEHRARVRQRSTHEV